MLIISLLAASSPAMAQEEIVEGQGYPVGEGAVLHTNVSAEGGIDSNVFYADADILTSPVLRILASAAIASEYNKGSATRNELPSGEDEDETITGSDREREEVLPDWDFRLAMRLGYDQYIGLGYGGVTNGNISAQSNLNGGLDARAESNPRGQLSFFVQDNLVRDNRPRNFESRGNLNRWNNQFQVGSHYRPGQGALDFSLRYENLLDRFDDKGGVSAQLANRMNHLLRLRAEWQFLPITRFYFDGSYGFFGPFGGTSEKVASTPLRLQLGVASLITEAITVRAHAGFGKGFYSAGPDFTMAIYGGEFGLRYSPVGRFTVAYEYDFRDSINSNFYRDHAIVGKVDHQIRQFLIDIGAQVRFRGYRGVFASVGPPTRDDLLIGTHGKVHYLTRDWLAFSALIDLVVDATAYRDAMGDDPSYTRLEVVVGATAAF